MPIRQGGDCTENLSIKNEANNFLLNYGLNTLPVRFEDLIAICNKMGYFVFTYNDAIEQGMLPESDDNIDIDKLMETRDGFTYVKDDTKFIYYRQNLSYGLNAKIIAHELGHIILNHSADSGILGYSGKRETCDRLEREANIFMRQVHAPLCVLYELHIDTIHEIYKLTMLDNAVAAYVREELRQYPDFIMPSDKKLLLQFEDYITTAKQATHPIPPTPQIKITIPEEPPQKRARDAAPNKSKPDTVAFWGASISAFLLGACLSFILMMLYFKGYI